MEKKIPFTLLSLFTVFATSCGSGALRGYTHTKSIDLHCYTADLNHNGTFEDNEKNLTWEESYDKLIEQANSTESLTKWANAFQIDENDPYRTNLARYEILHEAEELLSSTGAMMPIYNYGDPFLQKDKVKGTYSSPLGTKFFDKLTGKGDEQYNICLGTRADTLDPANNSDMATSIITANMLVGVNRWVKGSEMEGSPDTYTAHVGRGIADSTAKILVEEVTEGHEYYEYDIHKTEIPEEEYPKFLNTVRWFITIDENAKWANDDPVTSDDFIWAWHRTAHKTTGIWSQMFDSIRGYDEWFEKDLDMTNPDYSDPDKVFSGLVKKDDKNFEIQLVNDCAYFSELLAFPAFFPLHQATVKNHLNDWWTTPRGFICNGPFKFDEIDNVESGKMVVSQNENYLYKDEMTTKKIKFALIDDDSSMFLQYRGNSLDIIDSIPTGMIDYVKLYMPAQWKLAQQIGIYYMLFNVNDNTFDIEENQDERKREKLRRAMGLLVNRRDITDNIAKSGCTPADGFISTEIIERVYPQWNSATNRYETILDDAQVEPLECDWHTRNGDMYQEALNKGGYKNVNEHWLEYRNNNQSGYGFYPIPREGLSEKEAMEKAVNEAVELVKSVGINYDKDTGKFINFPDVTITTNSGSGHEIICERMQYYYGEFGIKLKIQTQEWNAFLASKNNGDFAMARNGWIADYSDPRTYLDISISNNGNNDAQLGKDSWHKSR